jgi:cysteinyl-tRNA synthetase
MGVTDIDDKIINKGRALGFTKREEFLQLAYQFEKEFFEDLDRLNVLRPDSVLKVSHHVPEIIRFIETLIAKNHAYVASNGVYFRISSLPKEKEYDQFGIVPHLSAESADSAPNLNPAEGEESESTSTSSIKENPRDFALWKLFPNDPAGWDSPWGWGRPGWHIECSSMTYQYFGSHLDIHSGGVDLKFPHHSNEIVQSECHHCNSHETWCRIWLHTGHLHIAGRKMSKSLKNFISIKDLFQSQITKNIEDDFRLFCLQHKYSSLLTYSSERIKEAELYRKKLESFFVQLESLLLPTNPNDSGFEKKKENWKFYNQKATIEAKELIELLNQSKENIRIALANDFDTGEVLTILANLIGAASEYNRILLVSHQTSSPPAAAAIHPIEPLISIYEYIQFLGASVFGLRFCQRGSQQLISSVSNSTTTSSATATDSSVATAINIALKSRSKMKTYLIDRMKILKKQLKEPALSADRKAAVEQEMVSLKELLTLNDDVRDQFKSQMKINVMDLPTGESVWNQ